MAITSAASREEFRSHLQANSASSDAEAVVDRGFQTGRYATLFVTYRGTIDGEQLGPPGEPLRVGRELVPTSER